MTKHNAFCVENHPECICLTCRYYPSLPDGHRCICCFLGNKLCTATGCDNYRPESKIPESKIPTEVASLCEEHISCKEHVRGGDIDNTITHLTDTLHIALDGREAIQYNRYDDAESLLSQVISNLQHEISNLEWLGASDEAK